jgi:alkylhydroperoxidase family enzyme
VGRDEGLTERDLLDLSRHRESDAFSEVEKLALDYALCLCETPVDVPDELFDSLRAHLDEAQLMELTATAAFENYLARFNRGFAVEAQGLAAGSVCPIPDHAIAAAERARGQRT